MLQHNDVVRGRDKICTNYTFVTKTLTHLLQSNWHKLHICNKVIGTN